MAISMGTSCLRLNEKLNPEMKNEMDLENMLAEDFEKNYEKILEKLSEMQDKIKRDHTTYNEEFGKILAYFKIKFDIFLKAPNKKIKGMKEMFMFFAQLGHVYPKEMAFIPVALIQLIENNYTVINPEIRMGIVESLSLLRKKDLLDTLEILPLYFKLLRCQDKILRKKLHDIIISDLSKINQAHKNNNVNKTLQNFCINNMLNDPNKKAARKTLNIMINLYKKKIWNDSKTVNAMATTCTSNDPKICYASCQFFLSEYEEAEADSSDEEELVELKSRYKLLGKVTSKKTKQRKNKLKLLMKSIDRREKRRSKVEICKDFMPIDLLNDPTNFGEKLFSKLKNLKENFKLKLSLLRLIGRVIGRHKIYINNYYTYFLTYLTPNQSEIGIILASLIESSHDLVPPTDFEPIINKLFDNFVSETIQAVHITIGLNTLREIVERAPYVIKPEHVTVIKNMKDYKNKSVTNAARGLINCLKEINGNLLGINDRDMEKNIYFGQSKATSGIEGIDLLKRHEKLPEEYKMEYDVILDDMQLRKLKVLRMKYAAEKVQNKKVNLTRDDVNEMAGDDQGSEADNEEEFDDEEDFNEDDLEIDEDDEDFELEDDEAPELEEDLDPEDAKIKKSLNPDLSLHESDAEEEDDESLSLNSHDLQSRSDSGDENNVHGFIDPDQINTYRKRFNEKKDQLKNEEKEEYSHNRKKKTGGETNKQKLKNKPLMMVIPKRRLASKIKLESVNKKIKKVKQQLGRFKRGNMTLKKKGGVTNRKKGK